MSGISPWILALLVWCHFSCRAALSDPSYLFFYDSVVHVEMTVNVCVGYIGWKPHARWEQQAQHNHQEQQRTMNRVGNREDIERINRT